MIESRKTMHQHGGDIYSHKNVLDFSANINFRGMPESVKEAARAGVDHCMHYPDTACRKLRDVIAQREQVEPGQVICGNGAADLIFSLVLAQKPREALVTAPAFFEYEQALRTVGCEIKYHYLEESKGFLLQRDILKAISPKTDLVFLCNPNNPTGICISPELLKEILKRCEECRTLLTVDECFLDFLENGESLSMKQYLSSDRNLFILKAFTKMYAMAGLRLGYGLSDDRGLLERIRNMRQPWGVSIPAQMAGIAAAREMEFAADSRRIIQKEREYLQDKMEQMGYRILGGAANYLFFQGPLDLYKVCLEKGILIRDCGNYKGLKPGWYRIAVKSREENQELLAALEQAAKRNT
ncbi:MAG: aminotransferase class I/II-fold pyridoxal phosphate-dependent enzyme [Lachnospiraceae bacterium]|jgi:threonine-phosphate decarboxylase|nr:aminotransferase class I/II-fold pyridoxal phosphate-dependent enzyme [Lachnospiraceae bacterium]